MWLWWEIRIAEKLRCSIMHSGSHERVGNYSGVTVDAKEAKLKKDDYTFNIV